MKQKQINLNETFSKIEKDMDKGFEADIISIEQTTNADFYGTEGTYDKRNGYAITLLKKDSDIEFKEFFGESLGLGFKKSNLYAFKQRYGKYPEIGMTIQAKIDDNGFFRIDF